MSVSVFVRLLVIFVAIIQLLNMSGAVVIVVGRAWMIGTAMSLFVMYVYHEYRLRICSCMYVHICASAC